jgi:hypothetical protein
MAYNQFTLDDVKGRLGITLRETEGAFGGLPSVPVSELLVATLRDAAPLALAYGTEKGRSEMIIAPILMEVYRHLGGAIGLFSGAELNVDSERGLVGFCDFLVSQSPERLSVEAPIIAIVEAKNENLRAGTPQCLAEMVAAEVFNRQRGRPLPTVYGAVTTGDVWRFLRLTGDTAEIDLTTYYLQDVPRIVGILVAMVRGQA